MGSVLCSTLGSMAASAAGCACPREVRVLSSFFAFFSFLLCRGSLYVWGRRPRIERRHLSTNRGCHDKSRAVRAGQAAGMESAADIDESFERPTHIQTFNFAHIFVKSFCGKRDHGARDDWRAQWWPCDVAGVSQEQVRRRPRRAQVGPPLRLSVSENWRESEKNVKYARIIYRIDGKATLVTLHGGGRRAEQDKIAPARSPSFMRPLVLPSHHAHTCPSLPRVFPAFLCCGNEVPNMGAFLDARLGPRRLPRPRWRPGPRSSGS